MRNGMLHIFRNNPFGRESLLQSAYFSRKCGGVPLSVYIPTHPRFNMTFGTHEVVVFVNRSYLTQPESAPGHVAEILTSVEVDYKLYKVTRLAAQDLPELATDFRFMACPRVVSDQSGLIGLGHIGPKVRAIVSRASFAVLIPAMCHKPWKSITAFFGGSRLGARAVELGLSLAELARVPFRVHTQLDDTSRSDCEETLSQLGLLERIQLHGGHWELYESGSLEENLFHVAHDSLVVIGAAGHGLITELVFGSKLEKVQETLPNPLLVVGPHWQGGRPE